MSLVTHDFDLCIVPGSVSQPLHLSQYDDARTFTAHLKDENGNTFALPSGATAKLEGKNCKGVTFDQACTVSGSDITFTPKEAATDQPGLIAATLHIKSGDENISTLAVILNVQKAGATKEEQARSPGFTDAIQAAVEAWASQQGFSSPTISTQETEGGHIITLTDYRHTEAIFVKDGEDGGSGLTEDVKQALLGCFQNVRWIDGQGQTYYQALYDALFPPANLVSISAAFNQGSAVVYETDSLDSLKQYLIVTANYDDQTTRTVTDYALSGMLTKGTSVITVSYGGKTTTFNVTVTRASGGAVAMSNPWATKYTAWYSDGGQTTASKFQNTTWAYFSPVFDADTILTVTITKASAYTARHVCLMNTPDSMTDSAVNTITGYYAQDIGTVADVNGVPQTYTVRAGNRLVIASNLVADASHGGTAAGDPVNITVEVKEA